MTKIVLASASPRRAQLLDQLGLQYEIMSTDVDECALTNEIVEEYVQRVTLLKAKAASENIAFPALIIAADTTVSIAGKILGKPDSKSHFLDMFMSLSGKTHRVYTAIVVTSGKTTKHALSVNEVDFRPISRREALSYWHSGEPQGKAGGYAIQGLGAMFVAQIRGSYTGVMGLPLFELTQLLNQFDVQILE